MFELRVLGGVDQRGDAGPERSTVLVNPKRRALLVYLALARPHGFQRRDTLIALLWPESSLHQAGASLRRAVQHIRRVLGDDVLLDHAEDALSLNGDRVWCDALAFERALDAHDVPTALSLYRGPLLHGFFVPDAPELERWVEQERLRLRARAEEAARHLLHDHHAGPAVETQALRREIRLRIATNEPSLAAAMSVAPASVAVASAPGGRALVAASRGVGHRSLRKTLAAAVARMRGRG